MENKLSSFFEDSVLDSVVLTDSNRIIEFVNTAFVESTGYSSEEAIGQNVSILRAEKQDPKVFKKMNEILDAGGTWVGEFKNKKKSGEVFWELATISPLKDKNGEVIRYIAVKRDITSVKKLEKQNKRNKNYIAELGETTKHLATATLRERELKNQLQTTIDELAKSKKTIEIQNKNILNSINYAQRIQKGIIPTLEDIRKDLPKTDWFYKPKDVVSGDFPFYFKKDNLIYYAAVDCTGHGVPGAMMSLIGYLLLNDILNDSATYTPAEVLLKLHKGVVRTLKQDQENNKAADGMDVAILRYDTTSKKLQYSGAHRPLYFIRDKEELVQYKGGKHPVGGDQYKGKNEFPNYEIEVQQGDKVYFFSDGFPDQFGGPKKLKYGPKRIRKLLAENSTKTVSQNIFILTESFEEWSSGEHQIDDVLFMGLEF